MLKKVIMERLKEHYDYLVAAGYEVMYLALQGSQNYGLDYEGSDIDSKAIVLPHFRDFVYERPPVSTVKVLDNNEHIDVKDIRCMFEMFQKQNLSYLELLYTDYYIINPKWEGEIAALRTHREDIAHINVNQFLRCIEGMSGNKLKALCHPYPNLIDKINKYGYDGKQLSHCVRLFEFISRYCAGTPLKECYWTEDRELLLGLKTYQPHALTKDEAVAACAFYDEQVQRIAKEHITEKEAINIATIEWLNEMKYKVLERKFKEDIVI